MSRIALVTFMLLNCLFNANVYASDTLTIKGRIVAENSTPIAKVNVSVGEQQALTDKAGRFYIKVKVSDLYQISFTKYNYFDGIQTFSHFELISNNQGVGQVADITLVTKKE